MNRFKACDGLSLAFADEGEGVPVLCLAGLTRNMADFERLLVARGHRARFIRLDARGRGASDHAPDPMSYSVPVEARDALALLDHLGLARAVIIGTSRGGLLAMTIAATAPERIAGVLLNDIGPVVEPRGLELIMSHVGRGPAARTLDEAARGVAAMNDGVIEGMSLADWRVEVARSFIETPDGLALRYDARLRDALLAQLEESGGTVPDLWPLYEALAAAAPLAVLRGAHSDILSREIFAEMQDRAPTGRFTEVPGRGHVPFLDEPESLAAFDWLIGEVET